MATKTEEPDDPLASGPSDEQIGSPAAVVEVDDDEADDGIASSITCALCSPRRYGAAVVVADEAADHGAGDEGGRTDSGEEQPTSTPMSPNTVASDMAVKSPMANPMSPTSIASDMAVKNAPSDEPPTAPNSNDVPTTGRDDNPEGDAPDDEDGDSTVIEEEDIAKEGADSKKKKTVTFVEENPTPLSPLSGHMEEHDDEDEDEETLTLNDDDDDETLTLEEVVEEDINKKPRKGSLLNRAQAKIDKRTNPPQVEAVATFPDDESEASLMVLMRYMGCTPVAFGEGPPPKRIDATSLKGKEFVVNSYDSRDEHSLLSEDDLIQTFSKEQLDLTPADGEKCKDHSLLSDDDMTHQTFSKEQQDVTTEDDEEEVIMDTWTMEEEDAVEMGIGNVVPPQGCGAAVSSKMSNKDIIQFCKAESNVQKPIKDKPNLTVDTDAKKRMQPDSTKSKKNNVPEVVKKRPAQKKKADVVAAAGVSVLSPSSKEAFHAILSVQDPAQPTQPEEKKAPEVAEEDADFKDTPNKESDADRDEAMDNSALMETTKEIDADKVEGVDKAVLEPEKAASVTGSKRPSNLQVPARPTASEIVGSHLSPTALAYLTPKSQAGPASDVGSNLSLLSETALSPAVRQLAMALSTSPRNAASPTRSITTAPFVVNDVVGDERRDEKDDEQPKKLAVLNNVIADAKSKSPKSTAPPSSNNKDDKRDDDTSLEEAPTSQSDKENSDASSHTEEAAPVAAPLLVKTALEATTSPVVPAGKSRPLSPVSPSKKSVRDVDDLLSKTREWLVRHNEIQANKRAQNLSSGNDTGGPSTPAPLDRKVMENITATVLSPGKSVSPFTGPLSPLKVDTSDNSVATAGLSSPLSLASPTSPTDKKQSILDRLDDIRAKQRVLELRQEAKKRQQAAGAR